MSVTINTTAQLTITNAWNQVSNDSVNTNNTVTDAGQLSYQQSYRSGVGSGTVNQTFNQLSTLGSGATGVFDLTNLTQSILGSSVSKAFSSVSSITIKNHSRASGYNINLYVNSASGFGEPFGHPTGVMLLGPLSCRHSNNVNPEFAVDASNREIRVVDAGSGAIYELVINGHE